VTEVEPGVEHGRPDARAREGGAKGAHGLQAPGVGGGVHERVVRLRLRVEGEHPELGAHLVHRVVGLEGRAERVVVAGLRRHGNAGLGQHHGAARRAQGREVAPRGAHVVDLAPHGAAQGRALALGLDAALEGHDGAAGGVGASASHSGFMSWDIGSILHAKRERADA
jgi:hypothetical protein